MSGQLEKHLNLHFLLYFRSEKSNQVLAHAQFAHVVRNLTFEEKLGMENGAGLIRNLSLSVPLSAL